MHVYNLKLINNRNYKLKAFLKFKLSIYNLFNLNKVFTIFRQFKSH